MSDKGRQGGVFIVSGPSGAGKTTLCAELLRTMPALRLNISCTTRPLRSSEVEGKDYFFLEPEAFEQQQRAGAFLECAHVHGHWYGSREKDVRALLDRGLNVLLEIDWQGASQVAAKMPDAIRIFILPPSLDALRKRLQERGQDDEGVIARRLKAAEEEMSHADEARYRIVNEDFDTALSQLIHIFQKHSV